MLNKNERRNIDLSFEQLKNRLKSGEITQKSFILMTKSRFVDELNKETSFLDGYDDVTVVERIWYIINGVHSVVKCKYCDNKASFIGDINKGYRTICHSKDCYSKKFSDRMTGSTSISENRDSKFVDKQSKIEYVDDDVIKSLLVYDKYLDLLTNKLIINYLDNRFDDSYSRLETLQRIRMGVFEKPKCPMCGKPVSWIGRKRALYTTYCDNSNCYNISTDRISKVKETMKENAERYKKDNLEKYGVEYLAQLDSVKEKRKNTFMDKYGSTSIYAIPEIREKIEKTNLEKFGYKCVFESPEIRELSYRIQKENSKLQSSKKEDIVFEWISSVYNVERFYKTEEFPYVCDFYLPDYKIYIEFQGSQYHNGRAFLGTEDDCDELNQILEKAKNYKTKTGKKFCQYDSVAGTWGGLDVRKRNCAFDNGLNYLEIYSAENKDDVLNQIRNFIISINCENPFRYSDDVLNHEFESFKVIPSELSDSVGNKNLIIKNFCGDRFYKNELEIFGKNPICRRKLIQNRIKYLGKKESQISFEELIYGFKKSGIYYGYSHFNPMWVSWFIGKYNIDSIYDPCGGWGHHLLGMLNCSKIIYNDINSDMCDGINKIRNYFSIDGVEIHNSDAVGYIPDNVDGFFSCPPYFNIENYGNNEFENIDEYRKFLNKIFEIWKDNSAKIFGLIIREDLIDLIDFKYSEKYLINSVNSHLSNKRYNEYFYIFNK